MEMPRSLFCNCGTLKSKSYGYGILFFVGPACPCLWDEHWEWDLGMGGLEGGIQCW